MTDHDSDLPVTPASDAAHQRTPATAIMFWECPNCGQSYFGEQPPDLCDYCQDFTTWRPVNQNRS